MTSGLAKCQAMLREFVVLVLENCRMDAEIHYCARRGRGRRRELNRQKKKKKKKNNNNKFQTAPGPSRRCRAHTGQF
ncbi:hypothetical protein H8958_012812 [Nasalis larvatus]